MINSTLCYLEADDSYLMLHRIKKKNDMNHDKWIGVGGKLEAGESPEECVKREVLEETGLSVIDPVFRGILYFFNTEYETEFIYVFSSDRFEGSLKECDEGVLEWVPKKDMFSLPVWEGDKIFLDVLMNTGRFFSLKLEYAGDKLIRHDLHLY